MAKQNFITVSAFNKLWRVGPSQNWVYWNPTGFKPKHPAVVWQKETVDFGGKPLDIALIRTKTGVRVVAGCRRLTFAKAEKHWNTKVEAAFITRSSRDRAVWWLALMPKLKQRARRLGWL